MSIKTDLRFPHEFLHHHVARVGAADLHVLLLVQCLRGVFIRLLLLIFLFLLQLLLLVLRR